MTTNRTVIAAAVVMAMAGGAQALLAQPSQTPSLTPRLGSVRTCWGVDSGVGAFLYTACVSMFLGFLPWFRGLARGGTARISQVQLLQPGLTLVSAALLLGERVNALTPAVMVAVAGCVLIALRARFSVR